MQQGFLKAIRGCLVLLALITIIMTAQFVRLNNISDSKAWPRWLPLFLAILSIIVYSWALKAQMAKKNIIRSNGARYTCSILFCAAWLVSPIYMIILLLDNLRKYALEDKFFEFWDCRRGESWCKYGFGATICSFLMALFILLEVILVYRYERSSNARKASTLPTKAVVAPGPVQQYPPQPVQQFAYNNQPPAVYYHPQPVMTTFYQSPTIPYQYSKQAPACQPCPTPKQ
ncbi:MAG: hypothetical protein J3Q66DRAFT_403401 [Benniella sp.]|nr:MAG: hypothetical protein J3Q66DRAFT_403401 [Benniella sp.]